MNLALFDFDGTITTEDTYTKFIITSTPNVRLFLGFILLFPVIILYKLNLLPASKVRPLVTWFSFKNRKQHDISDVTNAFVNNYLPKVIRNNMLEKIHWHQKNGDEVYVVSASLSPYLNLWCAQHGVNVLCSKLEIINGQYSGKYVNGDCSGYEKLLSIQNAITLSLFDKVYAYGDTREDLAMLSIADVKYFKGEQLPNEY
ncbi:HAD-IB family phosphatase [Thalassotalea sp. M1531]|uniref:HAD-IB family phosphatase n=1 Tax=Thalassotalea algicola TaxID=2716224 RepID=A0A7Y0LGW0_9GAMM|nr:HAD-IB family phosphatase [Thalassotalea algicola]NMP33466.1 HAD-IB family phosphatase [Thalassotalea algicola]